MSPAAPTEGNGARPVRVLIADDQELFRAGVAAILSAQEDLEVVGQAATGRRAVALVEELAPDVVLMDVRMPDMDGVDATRAIFAPARAARRTRAVAVVVLTTFDLDERAATAIRLGASGFLLKETTPAALCSAVRAAHLGHAVMAPGDLGVLLSGALVERGPAPAAMATLSPREREVFDALARGRSNAEIASAIYASESTIKTHVGAVLRKLSLRDRIHVVVFAHEHHLLDRDR